MHSSIFLYISKRCNLGEKIEHFHNDFMLIEYHQNLCYNCAPFLERNSFITKLLHQNWRHKKNISQSLDRTQRSKTNATTRNYGFLSVNSQLSSKSGAQREKFRKSGNKRRKVRQEWRDNSNLFPLMH